MLRLAWQSTMIRLARNQSVKRTMQNPSATGQLAARYVAGPAPADALKASEWLMAQRVRVSMFYLGEYVDTRELADENVENKIAVTRALRYSDLDVHVSVDPTQVGFSIDRKLARENLFRVAEEVKIAAGDRPGIHCRMLDMEDAALTSATIELHDAL